MIYLLLALFIEFIFMIILFYSFGQIKVEINYHIKYKKL